MGIKNMRMMDRYEAERFGKPMSVAFRYRAFSNEEEPSRLRDELIQTKEREIQILREDLKRSAQLLEEMRKIVEDAGLLKKPVKE